MRAIVILSLLLASCTAPHEGEHIGPFEGLAWAVSCSKDTPESLHERYEYENPYYVCDEFMGLDSCPAIWVHRYRYEWAKREWRQKCERSA